MGWGATIRHHILYMLALTSVAALLCPSPAAAAKGAFDLCENGGAARAPTADTRFGAMANSVEADLASAGDPISTADRFLPMLDATADADGGQGGLAAFCIAAGQVYWLGRDGNPYQARAFLLDGLRLAQSAHDSRLAALAAYRLGAVTNSSTTSMTRGLKRSVDLSSGVVRDVARASADPCVVLPGLDPDTDGPLTVTGISLSCAVERAAASGDEDLTTRARLRLARFWLAYGRRLPDRMAGARASAARIVREALPQAALIADPALRTSLLGRLIDTSMEAQAAPDAVIQAAADVMRSSAGADPASQALALAAQARIDLVRGDRMAAAALLRQAIFAEMQAPLPIRLADWYLLLAQAEPATRPASLAAALRALNQVRPLIGGFDRVTEESNFTQLQRPVFEAVVDHKLAAITDDDPAAVAAAQAIVEQYRQAELQNAFGSACVAARAPLQPGDLKVGELLLYPILLPDRVELLYAVGQRDGLARYHRVPVGRTIDRAEVLSLVSRMVDSMSYGGDDLWREPSRRLYDLMIAPLAGRMGPQTTLIVVPDGPLSALPFGALTDPAGHFLIERARISVVPSLAYSQPGGEHAVTDPRVVAATLEKEVDLPFGSYSKLEAVQQEAQDAVSAGGGQGAHNLVIRNFSRADLAGALATRQIDVLHLATHANFNGRSDRSYIVADDELIRISDLRAMIAQNRTRGEQLDLLVLSACETAVGDDAASMGLAGTAVQAGARSALASLWQVNDIATGTLMRTFYDRYRATGNKAGALRDAQLAMIAGKGGTAEPNLWAAFTLLGAWR